jgi:transposase
MARDGRILSQSALHELHRHVIRLHKAGHKVMQIVALSGLSLAAVRRVIGRYAADSASSLKPKDRGRSAGDPRSLSADQEAHIHRLICEKRPEQLKMDFALGRAVR